LLLGLGLVCATAGPLLAQQHPQACEEQQRGSLLVQPAVPEHRIFVCDGEHWIEQLNNVPLLLHSQHGDDSANLEQALHAMAGNSAEIDFAHGSFYLPRTVSAGGADGSYNNTTLSGTGIFSTVLTGPGLLLEDGPGHKSRFNIVGMTFVGGQAPGGTAADCVHQGTESDVDTNQYQGDATFRCSGNGWLFGSSSGKVAVNRMNAWDMFDVENGIDGESYPYGPQDVFSMGSLRNFNRRNGITIDNLLDGNDEPCHFVSIADHHESNRGFNWYVDHCVGFVHIGGWGLTEGYADAYLGPETARALWMGNRSTGPVRDLGFYNVIRDNHYQQFLSAPDVAGAGALRDKFPLLEDYMDLSLAADWDMSAPNANAWHGSRGAQISKTNWNSAITGQQYLRVACATAPCEATQRIAGNVHSVWLRAIYTGSGDGSYCDLQLRRSDTHAVLWDSTPLHVVSAGPYYRSEFAAGGVAHLPAGDWVLALRNTSAHDSCFFTDVRLVRNYVPDGSFDQDPDPSWQVLAGHLEPDRSSAHSGPGDGHLTGMGARLAVQVAPHLRQGDYYLVSGWVRQNGKTPCRFGYGWAWDGSQLDRVYSAARVVEATRTAGQWEGFSYVVRNDTPNPISLGTFPNQATDCSIDDVSMIHLNEAPQLSETSVHNLTASGERFSISPEGALSWGGGPAIPSSANVGQMLRGTSSAIGGAILAPGSCASQRVAIAEAKAGMDVPQPTPETYPGDAFEWSGYIAAPGAVTVRVCNRSSRPERPERSRYAIRVIP
jgi:hypothetical protein